MQNAQLTLLVPSVTLQSIATLHIETYARQVLIANKEDQITYLNITELFHTVVRSIYYYEPERVSDGKVHEVCLTRCL